MLNDRQATKGKKMMEENFEKVSRVFNTFCKFISAHCLNKDRAVDTTLIGLFIPCGGKVTYMPLPDFLEAGKFKLQRSA
jgi:hypothetical protein